MKLKVIKNTHEYQQALQEVGTLGQPIVDSAEADELELWRFLLEKYEREHMAAPSPVEAIRLRMEQEGLKPADLVPYIGSRSKVSEVLSGQRALSLTMIRKLHKGLGIPAEILIGGEGAELPKEAEKLDWNLFPVAEMVQRGWVSCRGGWREVLRNAEEVLGPFLFPRGMDCRLAAFMKDRHFRGLLAPDEYALWAWIARVLHLATEDSFDPALNVHLTEEMVDEIVHLSRLDEGPRLASELLRKSGIHFVFEPPLTGAVLDGASMRCPQGHCVVALTLRHDRLDHFWQTLIHELVHVLMHLQPGHFSAFVDDVDTEAADDVERDTDEMTANFLIDAKVWAKEKDSLRTAYDVRQLAAQLRVHPAIIAGRMQRENGNRQLFSELVGQGKVKRFLAREARPR